MSRLNRDLLDEQIEYYRARAPEYDEWFFRRGRYDRGEGHRRAWFAELARVEDALREAGPGGRILELACGTGLWTRHLVEGAECVVAVDAAPEALELNRRRVGAANVTRVRADVFAWETDETFDFIFFGFWLSHVPPDRFGRFWSRLGRALRPNGRVFFVDSARHADSTARDHHLPDVGSPVVQRRLTDGREYRVIKVFYEPAALRERLAQLGWTASVDSSGQFFIYGTAAPSAAVA